MSANTMLSQCGGDARWPGWKPQNGIAPVSLRTGIVASAALATASFLLAPTALAASHRGHPSDSPGFSLDLNTLVTVKGTDVFTVVDLSGTNDPVSAGLMLKFINRVAKLR